MATIDLAGLEALVLEVLELETGVDASNITCASRFDTDLQCDSLDRLQISMACETQFEIDLPDEDTENLATVGDLVTYIGDRLMRVRAAAAPDAHIGGVGGE